MIMRGENNNNNQISADKNEYSGPLFTIRWKWLLGTIACFTVLGAILCGVYYFQTKDQGEFLIRSISENLDKDNFRRSLEPLVLYQKENPTDMNVVRALAQIYDENAQISQDSNNAIYYLRILRASGEIKDRDEELKINKRILDNQRKISDHNGMLETIQILLPLSPNDPEAWKCLVQTRARLLAEGKYELTKRAPNEPLFFNELIEKALRLNPGDNELTSGYVTLLHADNKNMLNCTTPEFQQLPLATRAEKADKIMNWFVDNKDFEGNPVPEKNDEDEAAKNAKRVSKLLIRYEYRLGHNQTDPNASDIDSELKEIISIDPNNAIALSFINSFLEQQAFRIRAEKGIEAYEIAKKDTIGRYQKMIAANRRFSLGYIQLANLYRFDGDMENRIATLEKGNEALRSNDLGILIPLVSAYLENNDATNAAKNIRLIHQWIERNRGRGAERIRPLQNIAMMFEARLLAIQGEPAKSIEKFRNVFEPSIPAGDDQLIFDSLIVYAEQLGSAVLWEQGAEVYLKIINYFEKENKATTTLNINKMIIAYTSAIGAYAQIGMTNNIEMILARYIGYLRKILDKQNNHQMARFWLASALDSQNRNKPNAEKNWDEIQKQLDILKIPSNKKNVIPPWQVDLLQAKVLMEQIFSRQNENAFSEIEERILIPIRLAENTYSYDLTFLQELEGLYNLLRATKDSERVMSIIHDHKDGLPLWYAIRVMRLSEIGNLREMREVVNEAIQKFQNLPEKEIFLQIGNSLKNVGADGQTPLKLNKERLEQLRKEAAEKKTIPLYFQVGLLELDMGNLKEIAEIENTLMKMEGEKDGTLYKYLRAERLIQSAEKASNTDPNIVKAREIQGGLAGARPKWDRTFLLLAHIEDKVGNERGVLRAKIEAIKKGNNESGVYRDVVYLANKLGDTDVENEYAQKATSLYPNIMQRFYSRFDPPFQAILDDFLRAIRREDVIEAEKIARQWLSLANQKLESADDQMQLAIFNSVIGQGFFSIDKLDIAQKYFEAAAVQGGETVLPLAKNYAASGDLAQSLKIIQEEMEKTKAKSRDETIFIEPVLGLLRDYNYKKNQIEWLEKWAEKYDVSQEESTPKILRLITFLMVRNMQEKTIPFYRRLCELNPKNPVFKNDLAFLIANQQTDDDVAKKEHCDDAMKIIDDALAMANNDAMIIDTKGLVFLLQNKLQDAVACFEKSYNSSGGGLIFQLHLAVALLRSGEKKEAEKHFEAIREIFKPQLEAISAANKKYYEELAAAFPQPESAALK
ncbi:MAG: hypothetical protein LBT05_01905 [Planctomycetaceae bacterium]|jgi:hypothetical protein|nr:hypothetical protein [Planctomycetaceae bacterium]